MEAQPGWYPDPSQPGAVRWWDGGQWSDHSAPAAPMVYASSTDGLAVASLVTAVVGIPVVPIVLGMKARTRIRESGHRIDGDGLAIAGIVIGWIQVAIVAVVIIAVVTAAASA